MSNIDGWLKKEIWKCLVVTTYIYNFVYIIISALKNRTPEMLLWLVYFSSCSIFNSDLIS